MSVTLVDLDAPADPPRAARPAAFRRPGLVLAYAVYLLVAGFAVAAPWSSLVRATVSGYPRGDAELFDRGGVMLVEAVRLAARGAPAATTSSGLAVVLTGALGLIPFAILIAGLGRAGRVRASFLAGRAARAIGTLTLLWGVSFAAQAILAALVSALGIKIIGGLHLGARGEFTANVTLGAVALLLILPLGVGRDLAAVSAVNDETRFYTSFARGLRVVRRAFGRAVGGYLVRSLLAIALLLTAAFLPALLRGSDAPPTFAIPFPIHQLALLLAIFLRASWLASAIRLLDDRAPLPRLEPTPLPVAVVETVRVVEPIAVVVDPVAEEPIAVVVEPVAGVEPVAVLAPIDPLAPAPPEAPLLVAPAPLAPDLPPIAGEGEARGSVDPDGVGEPER